MYTCCPICKTNFKVSEAQLQVAQGKVRCGSCKNVFNARQHIHYTSPPATNKTSDTALSHRKPTTTATEKPVTNSPSQKSQSASTTPVQSTSKEQQTKASSTTQANPEIDAIFNALDTQLSQGTYDDIAKPEEPDIREAAFSEIFNEDEFDNVEKPRVYTKPSKVDNDLDLNLYDEPADPITNSHDDLTLPESKQTHSNDKQESQTNTKTKTSSDENNTAKKADKQHTFDFVNLTADREVSKEDQEQLAVVDKPLSMEPTNTLVTKTENDELHQAIDNIIQVNNSITTPFEENDADHFVIEMQTEPDVELVDENDLDKLFASTDNLKISDLKFEQHLTKSKTNIDAPIDSEPAVNQYEETELELTPDIEEENLNNDFDSSAEEINFSPLSNQDDTSLDFKSESSIGDDFPDIDNSDSSSIDLEQEINTSNPFEEEIVLSSADDDVVPVRLRTAVASLEQPTLSLQKRLFYTFTLILLICLSLFQLVLFKSTAVANTLPILQPVLTTMCQKLPCRYTGNHNRKQIKIISRDVRLHPKIKGALLISATIANQADFTQPYPTILLKFTDLTGSTVAQRYFQPNEYLGLLNKPFALMPSKKSIQLNIEILDPGSDAINFQFYFI